jgi:hypothetical protein
VSRPSRYAYTEAKEGSGHVCLSFGASDKKVTQQAVFVEFSGDVVNRTWGG